MIRYDRVPDPGRLVRRTTSTGWSRGNSAGDESGAATAAEVGGEDVPVKEVDGLEAEDPAACLEGLTAGFGKEHAAGARTPAKMVTNGAARNHRLLKKRPLFIAPPSRRRLRPLL